MDIDLSLDLFTFIDLMRHSSTKCQEIVLGMEVDLYAHVATFEFLLTHEEENKSCRY